MPPDTTADPTTADAGGYLAIGSQARIAALLLLGNSPQGVTSVEIRSAIRTADPRVCDEDRMKRLLGRLRDAGLAATERDDTGIRWYSPAARTVADVRGDWQAGQPPAPCSAAHPIT